MRDAAAHSEDTKAKEPADSFGEEAASFGAFGDPRSWSGGEPYRIASELVALDVPFWVGLVAVTATVELLPLTGLFTWAVLVFVSIITARDLLAGETSSSPAARLGGVWRRYGGRFLPYLGATSFLVGLTVFLLGGAATAGLGGWVAMGQPSLETGTEEILLVTSAALGGYLVLEAALSALLGFTHEEVAYGDRGVVDALSRSVDLVRGDPASVLGFFAVWWMVDLGVAGLLGLGAGVLHGVLAGVAAAAQVPELAARAAQLPVHWASSFAGGLFCCYMALVWTCRWRHQVAKAER